MLDIVIRQMVVSDLCNLTFAMPYETDRALAVLGM